MRANAFGDSSITKIICPSKGLPPWESTVGADLDGLEAHGFAYPLSTQAATDWLEGDDLAKVNAFLKETCKEVFGILPGADDGCYSLSGEAKEAALNMIQKLNESRDSNENDLF